MKLICYKGCHDFWINGFIPHLPRFFYGVKQLKWEVVLDESATYTLPGADQQDWNKGGGLSFNYFNHLKESAMWAWRWNPVTSKHEFAAYCHINSQRVIGKPFPSENPTEVAIAVGHTEKVVITLDIDYVYKLYKYDFNGVRVTLPFSHNLKQSKEITANFGGNNPAPRKLTLNVNNL